MDYQEMGRVGCLLSQRYPVTVLIESGSKSDMCRVKNWDALVRPVDDVWHVGTVVLTGIHSLCVITGMVYRRCNSVKRDKAIYHS